jgi:hypothetical protein
VHAGRWETEGKKAGYDDHLHTELLRVVRPFDLTIGPSVCNRDIFDLDVRIFTELPELVSREV